MGMLCHHMIMSRIDVIYDDFVAIQSDFCDNMVFCKELLTELIC